MVRRKIINKARWSWPFLTGFSIDPVIDYGDYGDNDWCVATKQAFFRIILHIG